MTWMHQNVNESFKKGLSMSHPREEELCTTTRKSITFRGNFPKTFFQDKIIMVNVVTVG
jgi:hypothetical protein